MAGRRPKARILKGFRDLFGATLVRRRRMIETILAVYERHGFAPLETPTIEYADVLGKYLPDADLPEGGIFAFRDEKDDWVALRYDLTAPLSRVVAMYPDLPLPYRRYQVGLVFRQEKPGPGRFREFTQCDIDTVGTPEMVADAEILEVLAEVFEALGIRRGDYLLRVSNRKLLNGVLEGAGIDLADGDRWFTVVRAIDKLDRVGRAGVRDLLGEGRRDPSGDFTPGARLAPGQVDAVLRFLSVPRGDRETTLRELGPLVGGSATGEEGLAELVEIDRILDALEIGSDRVVVDPTVVRGLGYYTGPVFEAELTFEITDDRGRVRRFGSVAGGGRYDDLVERFLGRKVPATGAALGIDRLLAALEELERDREKPWEGPVLVTVMDRDRLPEYVGLAAELRRAGIAAEVYSGRKGVGQQLRYADRRRLPAVVIAGEDEFAAGTVSIKDLARGRVLSREVDDRETWRRERPAQVTVPRERMVAAIREILGSD